MVFSGECLRVCLLYGDKMNGNIDYVYTIQATEKGNYRLDLNELKINNHAGLLYMKQAIESLKNIH